MTRSTGKRVGHAKRSPGDDLSDIQSPLMTISEACRYVRLGRSVLYERLHEFDQVRLGKKRFLVKASLDRYLERNTTLARASTTQPAATGGAL